MKIILLFIISISSYANCLQSYEQSYEIKMNKYKKKMKRYRDNRNNALFSTNIIVGSIVMSLEPPTKEHIFEEQVLRSAAIGTDYNTDAVMSIFEKLKPIHPFITPKIVQSEFKKGLINGDFCKGILGKYRIERAKKYVLKSLKSKRDLAIVEDTNINDTEGSKLLNSNDRSKSSRTSVIEK